MASGSVVVIGGSAGGLEALQRILARLDSKLSAAVLVVIHTGAESPGVLPSILERAGKLPARYAVDEEPIVDGRIYVAPPDHHLLIEGDRVSVTRGPRENGFRPAVDPLFRTAAEAYGPNAIGVILSGGRNDGTIGLSAIKKRGGVALVQDPEDASARGMPESAIHNVPVDDVARAEEIPTLIFKWLRRRMKDKKPPAASRSRKRPDIAQVGQDALHATGEPNGEPSAFVCPECGGPLLETEDGNLIRFRCHVGHAYTGEALVEEQGTAVEQALWTALRSLEEGAALRTRMAAHARSHRMFEIARHYTEQAAAFERQASIVRRVLVTDAATGDEEAGPEEIASQARRAREK